MSGRYTSSRISSGCSSRAADSASVPVRATPDRAEAVDLLDEPAVDLGDHEIVVDDEHVTHAQPCPSEPRPSDRQPHHEQRATGRAVAHLDGARRAVR